MDPDQVTTYEEEGESASDGGAGASVKRKTIAVRKLPSQHSARKSHASVNSDEEDESDRLPLAARDSQWAELAFYRQLQATAAAPSEEDDEEEVRTVEIDSHERVPMLILFPGLREVYPKTSSVVSGTESTTNVMKMLVGQKADFSYLKTSLKLEPRELKLPVVPEARSEEEEESGLFDQDDDDSFRILKDNKETASSSEKDTDINPNCEDSQHKRKRFRKKREQVEADSSNSAIDMSKERPPSKQKLSREASRSKERCMGGKRNSSHSCFGDDENDT